jgi:two-component system sensor histidine kinase KdpD
MLVHLALASLAVAAATVALHYLPVTNPTTVALSYLMVVLFVASSSRLAVAVLTSLLAMLALNFFFLPPIGTFTIADLHNWVALFAFLVVAVVASHLSTTARERAREAVERRNELARMFDVSRDVLLTTDSREAVTSLPHYIARRFELASVAICLPTNGAWTVHHGGGGRIELSPDVMNRVFASAHGTMEFDAERRAYGGRLVTSAVGGDDVSVVPLRMGGRPVGLMAIPARAVDAGTLDALGGVAAIAIERAHFLEERQATERTRERADFSSALLASFSHDLRTPLTAIDVAAANLGLADLSADQRAEQIDVVRSEVQRLKRLFDNILDLTRIDAETLQPEREWVRLADVIDASVSRVADGLAGHPLRITVADDAERQIDPRLTSTALTHLLENAAQYSPQGSAIDVRAWLEAGTVRIDVADAGPGIAPADLAHLFDRFYRGKGARARASGSGMGLAIARGLLAAEGASLWVENRAEGGATFSISLPAASRAAESEAQEDRA